MKPNNFYKQADFFAQVDSAARKAEAEQLVRNVGFKVAYKNYNVVSKALDAIDLFVYLTEDSYNIDNGTFVVKHESVLLVNTQQFVSLGKVPSTKDSLTLNGKLYLVTGIAYFGADNVATDLIYNSIYARLNIASPAIKA